MMLLISTKDRLDTIQIRTSLLASVLAVDILIQSFDSIISRRWRKLQVRRGPNERESGLFQLKLHATFLSLEYA